MRRSTTLRLAAAGVAVSVLAAGAAAAAVPDDRPGPRPDGTAVTPVGQRVTPAGHQSRLGDLPLHAVLSPDRRTLLVTNDGQGIQSLQVVDVRTGEVRQTLPYPAPRALFAGLAFSPDGRRVFASAGGDNVIRTYRVSGGTLTEGTPIALPTTNPAGVAVNLYPAGLAVTPDGERLVVADPEADAVTVVDLAGGAPVTVPVGHKPYWVTLTRDGRTAYVSNQGAETLSVVDVGAAAPAVRGTVPVGTHPNKSVLARDGRTLYVANGDSDEVSVVDTRSARVTRTIPLAPYPGAQVGSNPDSVALAPDGARLYVANAGNNDIAVVDLRRGRVLGLIPTGWYPTTVVVAGDRLFVTNAKGLGAGPNDGPGYPNPESTTPTSPDRYVGSMMVGTLSALGVPAGRTLDRYTRQVNDNNGFGPRARAGDGSVVPRRPGERSPIEHVIYVVKENRTFDQVLGSLGRGNGDPALNLFGDESAANQRALARRFVTLDNFYADAEVSAQGWNWSTAANSNPYAEQTWVANYSGRNHPYPSETGDPAIAPNRDPANAHLWNRLARAGIGFRNYGFYVNPDAAGREIGTDADLDARTDHAFTGFDLACPDSPGTFAPRRAGCGLPRYAEWEREFRAYEAAGTLPTVELVRLPNDHTAGTRPGAPTPKVYVADNDWALGRLVDTVSHSRYWRSTAIFVTEDDAQNGPDHVDAHRTTSYVIGPYSRHGRVDSTFYSTASMLRTMELIVGLRPMTQFDAFSNPMISSFQGRPDLRPYDAVKPSQPFDAVNTAGSPLASQSARQRLGTEDQIDEQSFNIAIWKSVRGPDSRMPVPRHAIPYGVRGGNGG
ncbi:MAG TPA: beta-propeller fold lactonase family protein [Mycobacteriales bacterium]|nr:beta-propeller fold lactonase family protein [Mycobacteriales bacterium]